LKKLESTSFSKWKYWQHCKSIFFFKV